jgi:hypothetical protein
VEHEVDAVVIDSFGPRGGGVGMPAERSGDDQEVIGVVLVEAGDGVVMLAVTHGFR